MSTASGAIQLALNAIPAVYADEPSNDVSASEPLPEGVEPLPEFVPAQ